MIVLKSTRSFVRFGVYRAVATVGTVNTGFTILGRTHSKSGNQFGTRQSPYLVTSRTFHRASRLQNHENTEELEVKNASDEKSIMGTLFCESCGSTLQTTNPSEEGYYLPDEKKSAENHQRVQKTLQQLKEQLLASSEDGYEHIAMPPKPKTQLVKNRKCKRCHDAIHKHQWNENNADLLYGPSEIGQKIPKNANIIYLVNSLDFPLSVSTSLLSDRPPANIYYVVTKIDRFYPNVSGSLHQKALPYFMDVLHRLVGARKDRVFLVSGKHQWYLKRLMAALPKGDVYVVGEVNAGKSTLVRGLAHSSSSELESSKSHSQAISYLPGFTRQNITFSLPSGTKLIDTPGFLHVSRGLVDSSTPKDLQVLMTSPLVKETDHLVYTRGPHKQRKIYNGKAVISVGGLVYLLPPADSILLFKMGINAELARFKDIDKARSVCLTRPKENSHKFLVTPDSAKNLARYAIPPFFGPIDIVIGGVGYFKIIPTGPRNTTRLFELFAPVGTRIIIRDNIHKYIYRYKDEDGNVGLRKVPDDREIFSEVVPIPWELPSDRVLLKVTGQDNISEEKQLFAKSHSYTNPHWTPVDLDQ
ncbi:unnamed protein product [Kuraishia capsulata CBS 1993]|uniref:Genetic interactor of prohibitins 3, mitochondrial n=1 Tax=Kuraishia capsulata CBS 1993 TaxID=1382522 RepID=W6MSZ1_9ASCO|nr:uncharacterized protein KUCA_T00005935001 [Kuraishia capsulata CBS 1993]CDK29941.1 unnamed protein product [Kuraishia capsulata CBS 1993]